MSGGSFANKPSNPQVWCSLLCFLCLPGHSGVFSEFGKKDKHLLAAPGFWATLTTAANKVRSFFPLFVQCSECRLIFSKKEPNCDLTKNTGLWTQIMSVCMSICPLTVVSIVSEAGEEPRPPRNRYYAEVDLREV